VITTWLSLEAHELQPMPQECREVGKYRMITASGWMFVLAYMRHVQEQRRSLGSNRLLAG